MNFFEFLGFEKFMKDTEPKNVIKFPDPKVVPKMPPVQSEKEQPKEYYRVGRRDDGFTTLTVMSGDGYGAITLSMNDVACEQLIKMLRSTYDNE
jgi:hypothetical protein